MATVEPVRTPAHVWLVGIVSLLWNAFGAYDYIMSHTADAAGFEAAGAGVEVYEWVQALPAWAVAAWAIGVWGSVLGSVLLLLRSRFAETAFLVSAIGALVSFAYQYSVDRPDAMSGASNVIMPVLIMIAIVAQWYYARRMAAAGVLR